MVVVSETRRENLMRVDSNCRLNGRLCDGMLQNDESYQTNRGAGDSRLPVARTTADEMDINLVQINLETFQITFVSNRHRSVVGLPPIRGFSRQFNLTAIAHIDQSYFIAIK